MAKTLKILLLQNQWVDCLEIRYVASWVLVFLIYINDDPELTLTFLMVRSNLASVLILAILVENKENRQINMPQI